MPNWRQAPKKYKGRVALRGDFVKDDSGCSYGRYEHVDEVVQKLWMRCTGTQLADPLVHYAPTDHECNVLAIAIGSMCCRGGRLAATSPTSSVAGYSCGGSGRITSGGVGSPGRADFWTHVRSKMPKGRKFVGHGGV